MVNVDKLSVTIANNEILKDIDLLVNSGDFISIIGANGSGKSTLINAITKNNKNYDGTIKIAGDDIRNINHKTLSKFLSTFAQHNESIEQLTVYDIASFGRYPHKSTFAPLRDEDHIIIKDVLEKLEIDHLQDRIITTLSGGELQRTYLASCLISQPKLLILDEPTNHLDIKHQYNLLTTIKKYSKENNVTVICILHDLNQAMKYADKVLVLHNKSIYKFGTPQEIITEELIYDVFSIKNKLFNIDGEMHVDFCV